MYSLLSMCTIYPCRPSALEGVQEPVLVGVSGCFLLAPLPGRTGVFSTCVIVYQITFHVVYMYMYMCIQATITSMVQADVTTKATSSLLASVTGLLSDESFAGVFWSLFCSIGNY